MGSIDFFPLAVALTRAEAAPTLVKLATKHIAIQQDAADAHERMLASMRADRIKRALSGAYDMTAPDEDELALFERAEARAVNSRAW